MVASFWSLLRESVVVQSAITLLLVLAVCYLYVVGRDVPNPLLNLTWVVMGFWFGQKIGVGRAR